ncbi:3'-5' exonuclease [uncultured Bosea sp.]|uniref:3'-5' exonuclease n=1 Tax=uncultured Bosea sp. TaxID=211457 RepID=UPI0025F808DE|nr:3'-5' exonuclease [uncultured Bosea sp.]
MSELTDHSPSASTLPATLSQMTLFREMPDSEFPTTKPFDKTTPPPKPNSDGWDPEAAALRLEQSGDYRILRRVVPRPIIPRSESLFPNLAALVDVETTGFDHSRDEVIEIGAVTFTYDDAGVIGDVVGVYGSFQEPSFPIPPEITRITGITDEMVSGHKIDTAALDLIIADADLVIAHKASFDRTFCEKLTPSFVRKPWACSVEEIDWKERGFEGSKLAYLASQSGFFYLKHRATSDCQALLEVLDKSADMDAQTPFAELLRASARTRVRVYAQGTPFDLKEILKAKGYRWSDGSDGRPKAWWIEVDEEALEDQRCFLRTEIYRRSQLEPLTTRLTAFERWRAG